MIVIYIIYNKGPLLLVRNHFLNFANLRGSSRPALVDCKPPAPVWLTIAFFPAKKPKTENNNKSIQGNAKKIKERCS